MQESLHVNLDGKGRSRPHNGRGAPARMCCLFSSTKVQKVGSGTTSTRRTCTIYWFIRQVGRSKYGVRSVDGRTLPWGKETYISAERLYANFVPEVALFEEAMLPAIQRWGYRMPEEDFGDIGYIRTRVRLDESNAYALLNLALDYFEAGKKELGRNAVNQLIDLDSSFEGKDQHLFNRFGIALRKAGLHDMAIASYRQALSYTISDDHLYYNLARAHYELGQWWECVRALGRCFEFNPELSVGRDLVDLTIGLARQPELLSQYDKPPVPDGVFRRAKLLAEATEFSGPMHTPVLSRAPERRSVSVPAPEPKSMGLPRIFQSRSAG